jgi:hypothetical protein
LWPVALGRRNASRSIAAPTALSRPAPPGPTPELTVRLVAGVGAGGHPPRLRRIGTASGGAAVPGPL